MTKIVVRLPEPKKEYSEDNQRQINRALSSMIQQLNSTYNFCCNFLMDFCYMVRNLLPL